MSKKQNKKEDVKADGLWVSDERRITNECKQVYPTLYRLLRIVLVVTIVIWAVCLLCPTIFDKFIASYDAWGNTFENVMLVVSLAMLVVYGIVNYFWQEKMKKFREKYEKKKKKS